MSGGALFLSVVVLVAVNMCLMLVIHTVKIVHKHRNPVETFWVALFMIAVFTTLIYCSTNLIILVWSV